MDLEAEDCFRRLVYKKPENRESQAVHFYWRPLYCIWAKSLLNYLMYGNLINIYALLNTLLLSFSNKFSTIILQARQFVIDAHI